MKKLGITVVKNALANIVRGGATAVVAIALPHFLTRALDKDRFAAWALMLQIAAYASYLDFGLQTAVARYLAQAIELGDTERRDQLVSTAFGLLTGAGAVAFAVIGIIAWQLHHIFAHVPNVIVGDMRNGILVLAASAALLLPMSTFTGVLIGLHRNEYPALAIGGTRMLGAVAVILMARHTNSLFWLALCIGTFNLLGGVAQAAAVRRLLPQMRLAWGCMSARMAAELARYCSVLTFFSFGMLLISGLDVTIVGYFNFSAVGSYALAATLIGFFSGLNSAVFSAFISPVAVLHARQEYGRIRQLVMKSTRLNAIANLLLSAITIAFGAPLLKLWVGRTYAGNALPILVVLMLGQTIRLTCNPFASTLLAMGEQRFAVVPGLVEAVSNIFLSIVGILLLGPIGVAYGTLTSAILGLVCYVTYTVPRVQALGLRQWRFVREGILEPFVCFTPLLLCTLLLWQRGVTPTLSLVWLSSMILSLLIGWHKVILRSAT